MNYFGIIVAMLFGFLSVDVHAQEINSREGTAIVICGNCKITEDIHGQKTIVSRPLTAGERARRNLKHVQRAHCRASSKFFGCAKLKQTFVTRKCNLIPVESKRRFGPPNLKGFRFGC